MSAPRRRLPIEGARARPAVLDPAVLAGLADGEARVAKGALAEGPEGVGRAAAAASARASELFAAAVRASPPASPIDCRAGCSFCCHAKVLVVAPEAVRLAEHLRATLPPPAFERLRERVAETDAVTRGLSRKDREARRVPCPLLDSDGTCSAYEARPIVCGGWTSLDAAACERHLETPGTPTPPVFAPGYEAANAVLAGLGKGCFEAGLDGTPLELVAALRIALDRPNASERFLAGRPIFAPAHDAEWRASARRRST